MPQGCLLNPTNRNKVSFLNIILCKKTSDLRLVLLNFSLNEGNYKTTQENWIHR